MSAEPVPDLPQPTNPQPMPKRPTSAAGPPLSDLPQPTSVRATPRKRPSAAGPLSDTDATPPAKPRGLPQSVSDSTLLVLCDQLSDIEASRIAAENRLRSLTETWRRDDVTYGKGISKAWPEVAVLAGHVDGLQTLEHGLELAVKRAMRVHPLGPWVKRTVGVGEKQGARLLAAIGDPASRSTVSQLWAYCGLHVVHPAAHTATDTHRPGGGGVAPTHKRGEKSNWNATAKSRVFLVAEACIKQRHSPYRPVYDDARLKYADATHNYLCSRCGPAGKPAAVGSPLSLGHQHARAMRLVMKAVLRDLWVEAHKHTRTPAGRDTGKVAAGRSTNPD